MGKGDKKSKRGKIIKGSHGVRRPRKNRNQEAMAQNVEEKKPPDKKKK